MSVGVFLFQRGVWHNNLFIMRDRVFWSTLPLSQEVRSKIQDRVSDWPDTWHSVGGREGLGRGTDRIPGDKIPGDKIPEDKIPGDKIPV